jgi:hypothetical protein
VTGRALNRLSVQYRLEAGLEPASVSRTHHVRHPDVNSPGDTKTVSGQVVYTNSTTLHVCFPRCRHNPVLHRIKNPVKFSVATCHLTG